MQIILAIITCFYSPNCYFISLILFLFMNHLINDFTYKIFELPLTYCIFRITIYLLIIYKIISIHLFMIFEQGILDN